MIIELNLPTPRRLTSVLMTIILALLALSLVGQFSRLELGYDTVKGLVPMFFVDYESNIPTWYSSMALMLASVLAGFLALTSKRVAKENVIYWAGIWLLFMLLSLDEIVGIHERAIEPLNEIYDFTGFLGYSWVILGAIAVAIFTALFLRFVLRQRPFVRNLIILSGVVFVGGAIGVEMISAWIDAQRGLENWQYVIAVTIEEGCEMTGVAIFIHALMLVLHDQIEKIHLSMYAEGRLITRTPLQESITAVV